MRALVPAVIAGPEHSDDTLDLVEAGDGPRPATMEEMARRLAAGLLYAALPVPVELRIGRDLVVVTVEYLDQLAPWAQWLGAEPTGAAAVYSSPRPGSMTRAITWRAVWRGLVIHVRHLHTFAAHGGPS